MTEKVYLRLSVEVLYTTDVGVDVTPSIRLLMNSETIGAVNVQAMFDQGLKILQDPTFPVPVPVRPMTHEEAKVWIDGTHVAEDDDDV